MQASYYDHFLQNLLGGHPFESFRSTKEQAYKNLKRQTKQDFGYDFVKWLEYGLANNLCIAFTDADLINFRASSESQNTE